jgi:hypothetical protein
MPKDQAKDSKAALNRALRKTAALVFDRLKLSKEERAAAWDSAASRPRYALNCFQAILNSYKEIR